MTFTSPMKSIVTCSLPIITNSNIGSDNIECKVISNLSTIIASNLHGSFYSDKYQYNVKFTRKNVK